MIGIEYYDTRSGAAVEYISLILLYIQLHLSLTRSFGRIAGKNMVAVQEGASIGTDSYYVHKSGVNIRAYVVSSAFSSCLSKRIVVVLN